MIVHIVGNRPQFIKLSPLYHELEKRGYEQCIIHSGQHYDENMSDIFFEELEIPVPLKNLGIGSGSHAQMTGKAMMGVEETLQEIGPSLVILYGDTDTTLAAALAAVKLGLPIAHVEGGDRVFNKTNPEECNRIVTDHVSDLIFCSDAPALECAIKEGLGDISFNTGDIMYDTYLWVSGKTPAPKGEEIVLMTWHRQENTGSKERMSSILDFVEELPSKVVCPLHPRTRKCLKENGLWDRAQAIPNLEIIDPVGYMEMVGLMQRAKLILTDSGGLSKESSFAGAKCLFMWEAMVWPDLIREDWIHRFDPEDPESRADAMRFALAAKRVAKEDRPHYYGNGDAAAVMADLMEEYKLL